MNPLLQHFLTFLAAVYALLYAGAWAVIITFHAFMPLPLQRAMAEGKASAKLVPLGLFLGSVAWLSARLFS